MESTCFGRHVFSLLNLAFPRNLMSDLRRRLVKIRYYDHVEFKNVSLDKVSPMLREAVGWIVYEDSCAMIIVFDRPCDVGGRVLGGRPSGLCVLKNDVVEVKEVGR
jgi:hypothetical protein